ncbi:DNA-directed RNA polymerase I subunit RPA43 isoform X2 [Mirounga leonina]|uniref:DNA-directed RNA polymerase I subunit RPA43 isoform X2 n=1 Tax=Mirounga leonina TaxID=9715 RepID=UPI00156C00C0|nr:DNA-directed RNA polymerase I subunit RPA43 isoform X2 [Mirounga leonina]
MPASAVRAAGNLTSRMAAGCSEAPPPKAASEGPVVGQAGVLPCLELPTYAAACALVNSRYSCLVAGPHRRHIALSPRYLNRKRTGIREQLDAELLRYSESLLGVPIAYDNIKVVGELGDIYDDQGHIHLNIEADFIIFCPEPGQKLMGTVNKLSSSHIGCLVHGCFNASIPKPEQMPAEQWQNLTINVGDELEFEVFRLDSDAAGVFCIRGKLNTTRGCSAYYTLLPIPGIHTEDSQVPAWIPGISALHIHLHSRGLHFSHQIPTSSSHGQSPWTLSQMQIPPYNWS